MTQALGCSSLPTVNSHQCQRLTIKASQWRYNVCFSIRLCFSLPPWGGLIETQGKWPIQNRALSHGSVCSKQCPSGWQSVFPSAPHHPSLPWLVFLTVSGSNRQHASHTSSTKNDISTSNTLDLLFPRGSPTFHISPTSHLSLMT